MSIDVMHNQRRCDENVAIGRDEYVRCTQGYLQPFIRKLRWSASSTAEPPQGLLQSRWPPNHHDRADLQSNRDDPCD